jgi:hypothetical protein
VHKLAKRLLTEQVQPKVEMILDGKGISERELKWAADLACLAREMLESDVYLKKIEGYPRAEEHDKGMMKDNWSGGGMVSL